jgi:hypothetical protein
MTEQPRVPDTFVAWLITLDEDSLDVVMRFMLDEAKSDAVLDYITLNASVGGVCSIEKMHRMGAPTIMCEWIMDLCLQDGAYSYGPN